MTRRRIPLLFSSLFVLGTCVQLALLTQTATAEPVQGWDAGNIISDSIFVNNTSMSPNQIQQFLNSKVPTCDTWGTQPSEYGGGTRAQWGAAHNNPAPFICLKDYSEGGKSSAQIIYDSAQEFRINPQVLIVLLQKEQGLVTDTWPLTKQYRSATGYGCPDTAPCDSQYYGLTNQLKWAARMFRKIMDNVPQSEWFTPYVVGNNFIRYNPDASCGGTSVTIINRATQALYNYTPYQPNGGALNAGWGTASCGAYGNRNFYLYFQSWFGSTRDGRCTGGHGGNVADVVFRRINRVDYADFVIYSGSSTGCVESHLWNQGYTSWKQHTPTIQASIDFPYTQLIYGDIDGDGSAYPIFFSLDRTGSSTIEAHVVDRNSLKRYVVHATSNRAQVDPGTSTVLVGNLNKTGKEVPILVQYQGTGSGMIEFHEWSNGMMGWGNHIATNRAIVDPTSNAVEFADIDGDGKDEAILISYRNTGSGMVEFHVWNPGQYSWRSHIASNMPAIDPANSKVMFADTDGDGKEEPVLVGLKNTGSGRIEFHTWNPGFTSWKSNIASNQPVL